MGHEQGADPHSLGAALPKSKYVADVGYFASGESVVKVGNATFAGHEQGPDPHVSGSPLPPSEYVNSSGCLADGTAMERWATISLPLNTEVLYPTQEDEGNQGNP